MSKQDYDKYECDICGDTFYSAYEDNCGEDVLCSSCAYEETPVVETPDTTVVDHSPHYRELAIEPITFIEKNHLDFFQGNIIKYVCRYKFKDGMKDLIKAKDYLQRLIDSEVARGLK